MVSDNERIEGFERVLHRILFALRYDRLEQLSEKLAGIQPVELHILQLVSRQPDLILREIREALGMPNSTLTSIINRMEERELLERQISIRDRRSYRLALTDEGRVVQAEHDRIDRLVAQRMLDALDTDRERDELIRLLDKIADQIES